MKEIESNMLHQANNYRIIRVTVMLDFSVRFEIRRTRMVNGPFTHVCYTYLNTYFQFSNNIIYIFSLTHIFRKYKQYY